VLDTQISWSEQDFRYELDLGSNELIASCHACSLLSDEVVLAATSNGKERPMVLLPCCHEKQPALPYRPWMPRWTWDRWPWLLKGEVNLQGAVSVDNARISYMRQCGFHVAVDHIDGAISKQNATIVATPANWEPSV